MLTSIVVILPPMPADLQIVYPQEAVTLTSVHYSPSTGLLDVIGQDFASVDEVLINDLPAPSFLVLSVTRLLAELPSGMSPAQISTIAVLTHKLAITPRSILRFRLGRTPSTVTGIMRLVQLFLKILFTKPGTDAFSPTTGGDALKNVGGSFGKDQSKGIVSDFVLAVDNTRRQIVALQSRDPNIPAEERLLSARVLSSAFDRSQAALIVSVEILSQAGRTTTANVVI